MCHSLITLTICVRFHHGTDLATGHMPAKNEKGTESITHTHADGF